MAKKPNDERAPQTGTNKPGAKKSSAPKGRSLNAYKRPVPDLSNKGAASPGPATTESRTIKKGSERSHVRTVKQRVKLRRLKRAVIWTVLIGVIGGLYFVLVSGGDKKRKKVAENENGVVAARSDFEVAMEEDNVVELMRLVGTTQENFKHDPLPIQIKKLRKRIEICKKLEELDADKTSRLFGISGQLDALILLDALNCMHGLNDQETRSNLAGMASRVIEIDDERIQRKAVMGLCLAKTHDYSLNPTDHNLQLVLDQIELSRNVLGADEASATSLFKLGELVDMANVDEHSRIFRDKVGELLKESGNSGVVALGALAHDKMLIGSVDFERLSENLLNENEEALERLAGVMEAVVETPKISVVPFSKLLSLIENLYPINRTELANKYLADLKGVMDVQESEDTKTRMQGSIDRYEIRQSLLNNDFQLSGQSVDGEALDELCRAKVVVLIYVSVRNETSLTYTERADVIRYSDQESVQLLGVCVEKNVPKKIFKEFKRRFRSLTIVSPESAPELSNICPTSKVPYVLVLDKEKKVVGLNIHYKQIAEVVENVLSTSSGG